jgi:predicted kinase
MKGKPVLYIPVAIPGAGKTTFFERLAHEGVVRVSTDQVREFLKLASGSTSPVIFERYHEYIRYHLLNGESVYADATNLRSFAREDLLGIATELNFPTHLILFRNLSEAIVRNGRRTGNTPGNDAVPPEAMARMIEQYEKALLDIPGEVYTYVTEVSSVR